ncbi:MAG TPA: hypothetical protein VH372_05225 [Actinospica sp.]|jgi:hypothetical protein|nr:hypothetical protein [Actinospica sp.]
MIRKLHTAVLLLTGPATLGLWTAAAAPASAATGAQPASAAAPARPAVCATTSPIRVDGFAFAPGAVAPGGSSTADLITTNCSAVSVATDEEWTGQWLPSTGTGPAAGCPVIDPFIRAVDYAPGQELAENTGYSVPVGCQAAELAVTVRISIPTGSSASVVTATAYLRITHITR